MLFSEVYGTYFDVLSEILEKAVNGELTRDTMYAIIQEKGFEESILTIPQNLNDQIWPLLNSDLTTPLEHKPTQPITTLQKRWMKALLNDPRIRLFAPPIEELEGVEPLYPADTFVYFDRYGDGDPFEDPQYIQRFQTILTALRERKWLRLHFLGRNNVPHSWRCIPYKLEYSPKDDKFRLITSNNRAPLIINLARITDCKLLEPVTNEEYRPKAMRKRKLVLELTDERNALERCMLHFSHLEKETERIDDRHYRLTLHYEKDDETELLIRVLSFGHVLRVVSPDQFKEKLKNRIEKQMQLRTQK